MITHPARPPCGARPARPLAVHAAHPARSPRGASTRLAFCGCSMRRWAAARPRDRHTRASRLGMIDLEARPGPAATHRHRSLHPNELRSAHHRQTSVRREACPSSRRPRRELRSARRLEARPGPAGLAPPSSRVAAHRRRCRNPAGLASLLPLAPLPAPATRGNHG